MALALGLHHAGIYAFFPAKKIHFGIADDRLMGEYHKQLTNEDETATIWNTEMEALIQGVINGHVSHLEAATAAEEIYNLAVALITKTAGNLKATSPTYRKDMKGGWSIALVRARKYI